MKNRFKKTKGFTRKIGGKTMKRTLIVTTTLIAIASQAAVVTWQCNPSSANASVAIVDEGSVYNGGLDYNAVSFGHTTDAGASYAVNGVIFYAAGLNQIAFTATSGITIWQSFPDGAACDTGSAKGSFANLSPDFKAILGTDTYREKTKYYEISGLVEGQEYGIQIFVNNSSARAAGTAKTVVQVAKGFTGQTDMNGRPDHESAIYANRSGTDGGPGSYLYGTFIAEKGNHQFTVGQSEHVNALNIQAIPKEILTDAVVSSTATTVTP